MTAATSPRRRRPLLIVLAVLAALVILLGGVGLWAVHTLGPRYGLYLTPPSPQRYAQLALEDLDRALYADGPEWEATTDFTAPSVETADGVTTLTVPALGSVSEDLQMQYAAAAATGIDDAARGTCGWIIDLRGNTGGNMYPMLSGLAPLLPDDMTASSGEAVLTAFRGVDGTRTFGADSAGYTSGNSIHLQYDGAQMVLTNSVYVDREGTSLEEQPIPADDPVAPEDAEQAAAEWLAEQGCD